MGIWFLYIVSVILSWFSMRYLVKQKIAKATLLSFVFILIPCANVIPMAIAVADIIMEPANVEEFINRLFFIKRAPESESSEVDES